MKKRLYRSKDNKVVAGILGGLGEYFDVDPALVRLGFVALAMMTAIIPLLTAYVIALFIVPQPPGAHE